MARVTVFVDDAVRGHLPNVCVRTGQAATHRVWFHGSVGGRSALWFVLVFFGPVGWIILLFGSGSERLDVLLPVSDSTLETWADRRRDRRIALGGLVLMVVLSAALAHQFGDRGVLPLLLIGGALLALAVTHWRLEWAGIDVNLDASRRWVTLGGAHPAFVRVVEADRQHARATPDR